MPIVNRVEGYEITELDDYTIERILSNSMSRVFFSLDQYHKLQELGFIVASIRGPKAHVPRLSVFMEVIDDGSYIVVDRIPSAVLKGEYAMAVCDTLEDVVGYKNRYYEIRFDTFDELVEYASV